MDRRLEGLKRLGGPVGVCSHCRTALLLALPDPGQNIYRHHWRVEERVLIDTTDNGVKIFYGKSTSVVCSAKCAADLASKLKLADGAPPYEKKWVEEAPEPCVESS